jgi:hypothetical protein
MGVIQSDTQPDTQPSCRHHKHEHRLDEDEIKPSHWSTRTGLTNGRHAQLHTTLPMRFPGWPLGTFSVLSQMWNWLMYVSNVIFRTRRRSRGLH